MTTTLDKRPACGDCAPSTVRVTSDVRYGITKQPPETCPLIDAAIKAVQEAQGYTEMADRDTEEELRARRRGIYFSERQQSATPTGAALRWLTRL